jgi:hypothetical protein
MRFAPQPTPVDELSGSIGYEGIEGSVLGLLVLKTHRVCDAAELGGRDQSRAVLDLHGQGFVGDEGVDEPAVERSSGAAERAQLHGVTRFGVLEGGDAGLVHPHPLGQLPAGHAECVAEGADPTRAGSKERARWDGSKRRKLGIEVVASLCS